jgi:D-alanine--poly(phosphoribitol) ligase subunit 2
MGREEILTGGKTMDWIREVERVFVEKLSRPVDSPDTDLFESGILDSMSLIDLLLQLEENFGYTVSIADLELDQIRTVRKIAEQVANFVSASA